MSIYVSHKPCRSLRAPARALRTMVLSGAAAFVALVVAGPAWANASLDAGQVWSGSYRCAAISGRASVEITRFETIAERPGWQRIEATLTIEENGRRGVARFAGNNPTRDALSPSTKNDRLREAQRAANNRPDTFLLGFKEWVEQPAGVEVQRLRLQPMRDAGGVARIGVNVHGRPECIVNGTDTFAFVADPARPDRATAAAPAPASTGGTGGTGVEVFGIRLGAPLSWPRCQNNAWTDEPRNRPCVDIKSWGAYFMFDRSTEPAMLFWGIGGERMGYLIEGRLERMTFRIYREDEHLQAFEQKFGAPNKELVPMHNDQGGRWTGFIHRWDVAGTSIQVDCTRFERVCSVEIETPIWRAQRQQDKDRRQKL